VLVLVLLLLPHDDTSVKSSRDLEVAHPTARKRTNQVDGKVLLHSTHSSSQAKRCNFFFFFFFTNFYFFSGSLRSTEFKCTSNDRISDKIERKSPAAAAAAVQPSSSNSNGMQSFSPIRVSGIRV
jgi:hypothetical protein